jgi:hypothetical protein
VTELDGDFGEAGRILAYDPAGPPKQPDGMPPFLLWSLVIGTTIVLCVIGLFVLNSAFADPVGGCGGG